MARVEPPRRTDTCPGCKGSKRNDHTTVEIHKDDPCEYCDGLGKVTNYRYKTLLRFFKTSPKWALRKQTQSDVPITPP